MAEESEGRKTGQDQSGPVLDKCSPIEDAAFGRMIQWLKANNKRAFTRRGQTLIITDKPKRR